jgi:hypothetical protein
MIRVSMTEGGEKLLSDTLDFLAQHCQFARVRNGGAEVVVESDSSDVVEKLLGLFDMERWHELVYSHRCLQVQTMIERGELAEDGLSYRIDRLAWLPWSEHESFCRCLKASSTIESAEVFDPFLTIRPSRGDGQEATAHLQNILEHKALYRDVGLPKISVQSTVD